ncbi:nucleotidyltransferase family protein [bacterium]|nr:nucleotidyltransferase family protein [bacterium]
MKKIEEIKKILEEHKEELQDRYKIKKIGIFGSYIRNEQKAESDVDILVEFSEVPDLIEFVDLKNYLSELLNVKVDLVMKSVLKPNIGKRILKEVVYI